MKTTEQDLQKRITGIQQFGELPGEVSDLVEAATIALSQGRKVDALCSITLAELVLDKVSHGGMVELDCVVCRIPVDVYVKGLDLGDRFFEPVVMCRNCFEKSKRK